MSSPAASLRPRSAGLRAFAGWRPAPDAAFTVALGAFLAAVAFIAGGGLSLGPTTTVEILLQLAGGAAAAVALLATGFRRLHGGFALLAFALLAAVTIASVGWAVQPSDAWLESARTLAYLATFAGGIALVRLAPGRWASVLGGVLLATLIVSGYALATKVFAASLAPDETYARLREPFGYWNAVGLMGALGVPCCLWLGARRHGHSALNALAYPALGLLLVTVLLAYSRGSLVAVGVGAAFWFAVVPLRLRGLTVLLPGAAGALLVSSWAFGQDALSKDRVPVDLRATAGHELGLALLVMTIVLMVIGLAAGFATARRAPSALARRRAGIVALVALALVPVVIAVKLSASDRGLGGSISHSWTQLTDPNAITPANDPGRLTAVGSVRAKYYDQALKIYHSRELYGAGAGGFATARARFRTDGYEVRHAHGYLFQTLADLGLLGLAVNLLLFGAWIAAAANATGLRPGRWRQGPFDPERVGLLTLTSVVVVFGAHSLVDWTWFVPGTCVIGLLCAAWVAGRGPGTAAAQPAADRTRLADRLRAGAADRTRVAAAAAVIVVAAMFAWATWQPQRSVSAGNNALALAAAGKLDAARTQAQRAADMDPLSVDPLYDLAVIENQAGRPAEARRALEDAVALQPQSPTPWLRLAEYDLGRGRAKEALKELGPALYLDPRSTSGVTLFLEASRQVGRTGVVVPGGRTATATP